MSRTRALPTFIRPPDGEGGRAPRPWIGIAIVAALALLLCVQVVLADREALAADARWRPVVIGACAVLRCDVPPWREPEALTLVRRDVRPLPGHPGVLRVSAEFRNDAVWRQAWRALVLKLSDIDGGRVGTRTFAPGEYMGEGTLPATIASGAEATMDMDILEPAPDVVAFTFDFR